MGEAELDLLTEPMTAEFFAAWALEREGGWELLNGLPVRAMVEGAGHRAAKLTLAAALDAAIPPGHPCRPEGDGGLVLLPGEETALSPDAAIDGTPQDERSVWLTQPLVVFEVAVSSRSRDLGEKRSAYFRHASVAHVVVILPEERRAVHFRRGISAPAVLADGPLTLDPPGVTLEIADLWRRL